MGLRAHYYCCLFCRTGYEMLVARIIAQGDYGVIATPVRQIKHKSKNGVKTHEEVTIFPGYVFLSASETLPISSILGVSGVLSVLRDNAGSYRLAGGDEQFAKWLFDNDGCIGVSEAYGEGSRVTILSGPLKDYEGRIKRIDAHNRNGLVEIEFGGRVFKVWMAFDFIRQL